MVKTTSFERACMPAWHSPTPFKSLHLPEYMQMFFCERISHLEIDFYSPFFPFSFLSFLVANLLFYPLPAVFGGRHESD